jgi:hypothetical protein
VNWSVVDDRNHVIAWRRHVVWIRLCERMVKTGTDIAGNLDIVFVSSALLEGTPETPPRSGVHLSAENKTVFPPELTNPKYSIAGRQKILDRPKGAFGCYPVGQMVEFDEQTPWFGAR